MAVLLLGTGALFVACPSSRAGLGPKGPGPDPGSANVGIITTIAGNGSIAVNTALGSPMGVAVDSSGNLFIAEEADNLVREVSKTGTITTVAGNGVPGYLGDHSLATRCELNGPTSVALDASGNLYIADTGNDTVREVAASSQTITTVAGNGTAGYTGDGGAATSAELNGPVGITVDSAGDLFIADTRNNRIRKVSRGIIITYAGNGNAGFSGDGAGADVAELSAPTGVAMDASGNLFIADSGNHRVRTETPPVSGQGHNGNVGTISTFAGIGTPGFSGDGGAATSAKLDDPYDVAMDGAGNLYITDRQNERIRLVAFSATKPLITTVAGNGTHGFSGDGSSAALGELSRPAGLAVDAFGILFVADSMNGRVRMVNQAGTISTVAGDGMGSYPGDNAAATFSEITNPLGIAVDTAGNLYVADGLGARIRKISPSGIIVTVAGNGALGFSGDAGPATSAEIQGAVDVAVDGAGNLYLVDGSRRIREVSAATGIITTVAGNGTLGNAGDGGLAINAEFNLPNGVATDGGGISTLPTWPITGFAR